VGRGTRKSYCVLVSDSQGENAVKRLKTMCATHDGYVIAETDLELRGPGDFLSSGMGLGIRQSGGADFRIADLCADGEVLRDAFSDAEELLNTHDISEFPMLCQKITRMLGDNQSKIN
jgi:ATP-dependent DNA helicase RecG